MTHPSEYTCEVSSMDGQGWLANASFKGSFEETAKAAVRFLRLTGKYQVALYAGDNVKTEHLTPYRTVTVTM